MNSGVVGLAPSVSEVRVLFLMIFVKQKMARAEGFEPPNGGTRTHCLTTWRRPNVFILYHILVVV